MKDEVKERLVEKTMKDMLETLFGVEKYVLVEKIVDLKQKIDNAIEYIINHTQSTAHLEMDTKSIRQLLDILRGDE